MESEAIQNAMHLVGKYAEDQNAASREAAIAAIEAIPITCLFFQFGLSEGMRRAGILLPHEVAG